MENLWTELEPRVKRCYPQNKQQLSEVLQKERQGIGSRVTRSLVVSIQKRFQSIIK